MTCTPLIDKLLDRRLADPVRFADRVRQRPRATWSPTEPLMVVAADHPARGALAAGGRADAMADREHLLELYGEQLDKYSEAVKLALGLSETPVARICSLTEAR